MAIDDVCIQEFTAFGCTDSTATNYDSNATDDDGTCFFAGCTYPGFDNMILTLIQKMDHVFVLVMS